MVHAPARRERQGQADDDGGPFRSLADSVPPGESETATSPQFSWRCATIDADRAHTRPYRWLLLPGVSSGAAGRLAAGITRAMIQHSSRWSGAPRWARWLNGAGQMVPGNSALPVGAPPSLHVSRRERRVEWLARAGQVIWNPRMVANKDSVPVIEEQRLCSLPPSGPA